MAAFHDHLAADVTTFPRQSTPDIDHLVSRLRPKTRTPSQSAHTCIRWIRRPETSSLQSRATSPTWAMQQRTGHCSARIQLCCRGDPVTLGLRGKSCGMPACPAAHPGRASMSPTPALLVSGPVASLSARRSSSRGIDGQEGSTSPSPSTSFQTHVARTVARNVAQSLPTVLSEAFKREHSKTDAVRQHCVSTSHVTCRKRPEDHGPSPGNTWGNELGNFVAHPGDRGGRVSAPQRGGKRAPQDDPSRRRRAGDPAHRCPAADREPSRAS